jgi:transcriptional regulator with XRE-family HTH domain
MQQSVGAAIRTRRRALGLRQGALAARVGTHRPIVARTECGQHDVTVGTLRRYAEALGCSGAELLSEAEALASSYEAPMQCARRSA